MGVLNETCFNIFASLNGWSLEESCLILFYQDEKIFVARFVLLAITIITNIGKPYVTLS